MWEKETLYKLQLKINLVQDFCKKAFIESQNYDLVFVTKDNKEIPAHRLMLSISSLFFKNCVATYEHCEILKILLPDYSFEATYSFLTFLYSGEILMEKCLQAEFLALCEEFKVDIPNLKSLMDNHNLPIEELPEIENNPIEGFTVIDEETTSFEQPESVFICEESNDNTIEFQEDPEIDNMEEQEQEPGSVEENSEEIIEYYTIEETFEGTPDIDKVTQMIHNGEIRLLKAAAFYQIPKSTLHRRLKKLRAELGTDDKEVNVKSNSKTKPIFKKEDANLEAAIQEVMTKTLTFSGAELKYGLSKSIIFRTIHERKQLADQAFDKAKSRVTALVIADKTYSKNLDLAVESINGEGLTVMDAARQFGIPKTSLYRHMNKLKKDKAPPFNSLKQAVEDVLNGSALTLTALKYNISKSTLHRHVQRKSKELK
ncbi:unnamed protein product [Diamesa serratosioi]